MDTERYGCRGTYDRDGYEIGEHSWYLSKTDPECEKREALKRQEEEKKRQAFDKTKEKVKNNETVVYWHNNGKAEIASNNTYSFSKYDEYGQLEERFINDSLFIYEAGSLSMSGPAEKDSHYYEAHKDGIWTNSSGGQSLYRNGKNVSQEYTQKLNNATTIEDYNAIKREYPYHFVEKAVQPKIDELKRAVAAEEGKIASLAKYLNENPIDVDFQPDSYEITDNASLINLIERIGKLKGVTKIIVVGHAFNPNNETSQEFSKNMFVLSLNRAFKVKEEIQSRLKNSTIKYEHISCGTILEDNYSDFKLAYPDIKLPENRFIEIFVNFEPKSARAAHQQLSTTFNIQGQDQIIPNIPLLTDKIWNIYMNIYGSDSRKILKNIPVEFHNNVNVQEAINTLPTYIQQIKADELNMEIYRRRIKNLVSKIDETNYNILVTSKTKTDKKKKGK